MPSEILLPKGLKKFFGKKSVPTGKRFLVLFKGKHETIYFHENLGDWSFGDKLSVYKIEYLEILVNNKEIVPAFYFDLENSFQTAIILADVDDYLREFLPKKKRTGAINLFDVSLTAMKKICRQNGTKILKSYNLATIESEFIGTLEKIKYWAMNPR